MPEAEGRPYDLVQRMRELGADDPEGWAQSELREDIPQEARWLILRQLWPKCVNTWTAETINEVPAAHRAIAAGADPEDLILAMRAAAYGAVHAALYVIDGPDIAAPPDAPGWSLMEVRYDDLDEELETGRRIGGLHESILSADPSGREGADLWS
jgi:hypothetical protein